MAYKKRRIVFEKQIEKKTEYEIEKKIQEVFEDLISELSKEGICIFESPKGPPYYQKRKFAFPQENIYVSIKKDWTKKLVIIIVEHFGPAEITTRLQQYDDTMKLLKNLITKHRFREKENNGVAKYWNC